MLRPKIPTIGVNVRLKQDCDHKAKKSQKNNNMDSLYSFSDLLLTHITFIKYLYTTPQLRIIPMKN